MLKGRVALITGSTDGLGRAIAETLAQAGADVVIHGLSDPGTGNAIASEIATKHSVRAIFNHTDLYDPTAIETMFRTIAKDLGPVDIAVNNAVVRHFHSIDNYPVAEWEQALAVNVSAAFHVARLSLPGMKKRGWGRIIHLSSVYGSRGVADRVGYVTTKTALLGMTRAIAVEVAGTGVTCNALCPGSVLTAPIRDRIEKVAAVEKRPFDEVAHAYAATRHPTGAFVDPADVGAFAVFLCGPHSAGITGTSFHIDGGWQAA